MNKGCKYPASWQIAQLRAFPDPPGRAPIGIWIAFLQSALSIKPLMTCSHNTQFSGYVMPSTQSRIQSDTNSYFCQTKFHKVLTTPAKCSRCYYYFQYFALRVTRGWLGPYQRTYGVII